MFFETWNAKAGDESAISDFPSRHQAPAPVVKTHLCSTEAIDNVGLYNDVVMREYNTDVLVIRG